MSRLAVIAVDALALLIFATIGRRSHAEGLTVTGILTTAWPFLVGALVGHLVVLASSIQAISWQAGLVIAVITIAVGMALRVVTDAGIATSFVIVASTFVALFLVGWRLLARWKALD